MKKILFIYPEMMIGGSTTSLVSLLNAIDYTEFEVDLILYKAKGPLIADIPKQVNVLPQASRYPGNDLYTFIKKTFRLLSKGYITKALLAEWKYHKRIGLNNQVMAYGQAAISKGSENEYDAAIGFLELWSHAYLTGYTKAVLKIGWIHVDYEKAHYIPKLDEENLGKLDKIVSVSQSCLNSFNKSFPAFHDKAMFMENVLSSHYIREKAGMGDGVSYEGLKIATLCRLVIETKGLDRAVLAAAGLKNDGCEFRWFIIGDGPDRQRLEGMIEKHGLSKEMILLGQKLNPYPYLKSCDLFVLPSRYEGKPVSVTEAQILGLPAIITEYASAGEQVNDGTDGLIVKNNSEVDVYRAIKRVFDEPEMLERFKKAIAHKDLNNDITMKKFYDLLV